MVTVTDVVPKPKWRYQSSCIHSPSSKYQYGGRELEVVIIQQVSVITTSTLKLFHIETDSIAHVIQHFR